MASGGGLVKLGVGRPGGSAGWWDLLGSGDCVWAAYRARGAATFNSSLLDLSGNGNHAVDPGLAATPAWDTVRGWKFDGAATYLQTTFTPESDQSQTIIAQFGNADTTDGNRAVCGMYNENSRRFGLLVVTVGNGVAYWNGVEVRVAPVLSEGNLCVAGTRGYRNGTVEGASIGTYTSAPSRAVYMGCVNWGSPAMWLQVDLYALAIYDCVLTAPQVAAIAAAMAVL